MSIIEKISASLNSLSEIEIVDIKKTPFNYLNLSEAECVRFFIAPAQGIYDIQRLNALIEQVESELQPASGDIFHETMRDLIVGRLDFEEEIGLVSVETSVMVVDPSVQVGMEYVNGCASFIKERPLIRRIRVLMYPDTSLAQRRSDFLVEGQIPIKEFRMKQPLPEQRGFIERWLDRCFAGQFFPGRI